jgi:hypothetical protein
MAASNGTLVISYPDQTSEDVDVYTPDAVATNAGFNKTGLAAATSSTQLVVKKAGMITEYWQVAAPTAVGFIILKNSAPVEGSALRFANCLNTLPQRVKIRIPVAPGDIIQTLQY